MTRSIIALSAIALAACLTGCPFETMCTADLRASTQLTLEDEAGARISEATVTFRADGQPAQSCEQFGAQGVYTCGFEVDGELLIDIQADGFEPADLAIDVDADGCHVITERATVTLTPAAEPA